MVIAYLSPAMPALSETFVYEELLAVERRGIRVVPVAVRRALVPVEAQSALAQRVTHLYTAPPLVMALAGALRGLILGHRFWAAAGLLISDMRACGLQRPAAWKLAYQFLAATKLAQLLLRENCTHLHVHFADTPGQIAMYASAMSGVPFTIMAHANDIFDGGLLLQRKAERAARLLTISEYNCNYLQGLGIAPSRLAIVRCGVSFTPRTLDPREREPAAKYRIGSLGRMVEKKGFDVLLHAVAQLKSRGHAVELSLAGDGPLAEELQQLVRTLGLEDAVIFAGSLAHSQVAAWMQSLDAFVLACKKDKNGDMDGIPVVLMEAMSQGITVVSTRLSGIPELVVHEQTGLLAKPADAQDLALQIERLILDDALVATLTRQAQAHVTNEFGQDVNVSRLIEHFTLPTPRT